MSPVMENAGSVGSRRHGLVAVATLALLCGFAAAAHGQQRFAIDEFRVEGNTVLAGREIEAAVYNFLGPDKSADDVEKARAALEALYQRRGYPTVTVDIPRQSPASGIILLHVAERTIGRVRVTHARYFEPDAIRAAAPSLAPGTVPNINDVRRDMVALNQWPDRAVAPELRPGREPNTMDVDLNVTDKLPLHGSIELNNRQSLDTTPLRLNASLSYDNLWQRGDAVALFFQVAPERPSDALVYSVAYTFRIPDSDLAIAVSYFNSNSDVTTIGDTDVVGKGQDLAARLLIPLGTKEGFSHNLAVGADYKAFRQQLTVSGQSSLIPLTYYPVTIAYDANWNGAVSQTALEFMAVMGTPGLGSGDAQLLANRASASARFFYLRQQVTFSHDLPWGMQFWLHAQGQESSDSLLSNEQFAVGGLDTVRGYLEAEVLGDWGGVMQMELRGPDLGVHIASWITDLRPHLFADGGFVGINAALPMQTEHYELASIGFGLRARIAGHGGAALDNAVTLTPAGTTKHDADVVLFRLFGDF